MTGEMHQSSSAADLEAQVSLLMKTIVTQQVHIEEQKEQDNEFSFTTFTAKQHCTLQMLLNGNQTEIADRFGVTAILRRFMFEQ